MTISSSRFSFNAFQPPIVTISNLSACSFARKQQTDKTKIIKRIAFKALADNKNDSAEIVFFQEVKKLSQTVR
jgi:hypothetical protein